MTWLQRHRLQSFLRNSLWPIPIASIVAALLLAPLIRWLDLQTGWTLDLSADVARAVTGALASSLLSLIVFVFSVLLVAVQRTSASRQARCLPPAWCSIRFSPPPTPASTPSPGRCGCCRSI